MPKVKVTVTGLLGLKARFDRAAGKANIIDTTEGMKIFTGARCSLSLCKCFVFAGKTQEDMNDKDAAALPFHDGCDCYYA